MTTYSMGTWRLASSPWIAMGCCVTFLLATSYCSVEALLTHSAQDEHASHHQPTDHHDEDSRTPSHDQATTCCVTLQAVLASKVEFSLYRVAGIPSVDFESLRPATLIALSRFAHGLSPPTREPPPARPFYRTTFASHAPPVQLA